MAIGPLMSMIADLLERQVSLRVAIQKIFLPFAI
jgi:hypothetical protein